MFFNLHIVHDGFCSDTAGLNSGDREHMAPEIQIFTIWLFIEKKFDSPWSTG